MITTNEKSTEMENNQIETSLPTDTSLLEPTYEKFEDFIEISMDTDTIYEKLLGELFETLDNDLNNNPDEEKLPKLDIIFDISKKTVWKNFKTVCGIIQRDETDLLKFINNEFRRVPSVNKYGHLLITGRFTSMIPNTFKKYVQLFVRCPACGSLKTIINKNYHMGIDYMICSKRNCSSPIIKNR